MSHKRQQAWAYLSQVAEPPNYLLSQLLTAEGIDPVELALRIRDRRNLPEPLLSATETRASAVNPQQMLADGAAADARLITADDPDWPGDLLADAFARIDTSRDNAVPPIALWVSGRGDLAALTERAITIVGTRAASRYGDSIAREFGADLAATGYTVVSGGALGIDAAAHQGALSAGGATIAVAAHGPGVVYPQANGPMFEKIRARGVVVSEYAPGQRPHRHRFLTRNRLAAAFGQATVLVEAGFRSGALSTVSWAEAMNRPVAAVPGPVTSRMSVAGHERIREQRAVLVASAGQVRELVETVGSVPEGEQLALEMTQSASESIAGQLSRSELRVFDALELRKAVRAEDVAPVAGLGIALTVHMLVALEQKGLVVREGNKWQRSG